ncbi:hypothetical protein Tco_0783785 [Tanacetum coccineum]
MNVPALTVLLDAQDEEMPCPRSLEKHSEPFHHATAFRGLEDNVLEETEPDNEPVIDCQTYKRGYVPSSAVDYIVGFQNEMQSYLDLRTDE